MRHAKHGARAETWLDSLHHGGMTMSCHECTEAEIVVDVIVAIEIAKMRTAAFLHEDRMRIVGAIVAGYTQRDALQVFLVRFGGLGGAMLEGFELLLQFGVHPGLQGSQAACAAIRMSGREGHPGFRLEIEF